MKRIGLLCFAVAIILMTTGGILYLMDNKEKSIGNNDSPEVVENGGAFGNWNGLYKTDDGSVRAMLYNIANEYIVFNFVIANNSEACSIESLIPIEVVSDKKIDFTDDTYSDDIKNINITMNNKNITINASGTDDLSCYNAISGTYTKYKDPASSAFSELYDGFMNNTIEDATFDNN